MFTESIVDGFNEARTVGMGVVRLRGDSRLRAESDRGFRCWEEVEEV